MPQQFDLGKAFQTARQGGQALNYFQDRNIAEQQRQRSNERQDFSLQKQYQAMQQKQQATQEAKNAAAQKDMYSIFSTIKPDDPEIDRKLNMAAPWIKQRNPHITEDVDQFMALPTEEKKFQMQTIRSQMGIDKAPITEQLTIYGPNGETKRIPAQKGAAYTPPEGWSLSKPATPKGGKGDRPYVAKLMAEGYMPGSRITGPMLDAFEAAAEQADKMGIPLTVEKLKQMEFDAVKNRRTGSTAGGRLTLARAQNIESGQELLGEMKETAKKLDFSNIKLKGKFEKWKKGQLSDPILAEYMAQRADSLFIITAAMKMNGVTDKAIEIEEEAFPVEASPRVFNAWFRTQMRALNRTAKLMNRDFGYGIKLPEVKDDINPNEKQKPKYQEGQTANGGKLIFSGGVWKDNI